MNVPAPLVEETIRRYYEVPAKDRGRVRWVLDRHAWRMMKDPAGRYLHDPEDEDSPHVLGRPVRFEEGAFLRIELEPPQMPAPSTEPQPDPAVWVGIISDRPRRSRRRWWQRPAPDCDEWHYTPLSSEQGRQS